MTQVFRSSTEAGPLRFIPRAEFALTAWPQHACLSCRWAKAEPGLCAELLAAPLWEANFWLVRDDVATTSDGRMIPRCARDFADVTTPGDVKVLRHALGGDLLGFVGQPDPPKRKPRERRIYLPDLRQVRVTA